MVSRIFGLDIFGFFIWGFDKNHVNTIEVESREELI